MSDKPDDIQRACRIGDVLVLKKALAACPEGINSLDPKLGWSPLYRAVICGHVDLVRHLLQSGADPNVRNKLGETPMHQAADAGNYKITQALLEKRADPNLQQTGKG
jgi:cytohesin